MAEPRRRFVGPDGSAWEAAVISRGRTSEYLNPKVHRPIVEFRSVDRPGPRRYAPLPPNADSLASLDDDALAALLARAKVH